MCYVVALHIDSPCQTVKVKEGGRTGGLLFECGGLLFECGALCFCNSLDLYLHVKNIAWLHQLIRTCLLLLSQVLLVDIGLWKGKLEAPAVFCYGDVSGVWRETSGPFLLFPASFFFFLNQLDVL